MDKRVGKRISKPNPKCIFCGSYVWSGVTLGGMQVWHCRNCDASFKMLFPEEENGA